MSDELAWVATCSDAEVIAALKRMAKETEKYKQQIRELGEETKKAESTSSNWIEQSLLGATKLAAGFVSAQAALQLLNAEYQKHLDKQRDAANTTLTTADAQIKYFRNRGRVTTEQDQAERQQLAQIAAETRQPLSTVYAIGAEAVSSQGNLTREQAFANVKMGLMLAPDSVPEAISLTGALGDVASLTGSADPRENAGLMLALGEQARIPSMSQIAKNVIPAAIAVKQSLEGTASNDAMALVTTLTSAMKDKEGALSGTAGVQLAGQLNSLFGNDAKVGKRDAAGSLLKKMGDGTLVEQITKLQNDPKARAAFFEKASFEAKAKPFVEELLTAGSPAARLFEQNRSKVPTGQAASDQADAFFSILKAQPEQQAATAERALAATANALKLANQRGAMKGAVRDTLLQTFTASGQGAFWNQMSAWEYDIETGLHDDDAIDVAIRMARGRAQALRRRRIDEDVTSQAATPEDEANAKKMDELIAELRGLRADQRGQATGKKNIDAHNE